MLSIGDFIRTQFCVKIPIPSASFASKTVIVTGANSGLEKDSKGTVQHIVRLGASKVILACLRHRPACAADDPQAQGNGA